jgi:hypothetical protein
MIKALKARFDLTHPEMADLAGVLLRSWMRYPQGTRVMSPARWKNLKRVVALLAERARVATLRKQRVAKQKVKRQTMAGGSALEAVGQALLDQTAVSRRLGPLSELRRSEEILSQISDH